MEEVKKLRKEISELKIKISTITKGVPFSQIDVSSKRLSCESLGNVWPSPLLYCLIYEIYIDQYTESNENYIYHVLG